MGDFQGFFNVLLIGLVFYALRWLWERHRTDTLSQVTRNLGLGLTFREKGTLADIPDIERLPLFDRGGTKAVINVMRNPNAPNDPVLFGYQYLLGNDRTSGEQTQTVALEKNSKTLPNFELRPERLHHKIGSLLGYQDIDFADRPEFSRKYLLRGDDTSKAISTLF